MALTRKDAKLVAEELYKLLRKDVKEVTKEVAREETEEYLCLKDAAQYLNVSPVTLYKRKDDYGCYTKIRGRILFSKGRLSQFVQSSLS